MIPMLYDKIGNDKIGELPESIKCFVKEERNGMFELTLTHPTNSKFLDSLQKEAIIVSDANDYLKAQKFRIYNIRKLMSNRLEICARHISFDLAHDWIDSISIENQSCEYALNTIFRNSQFSQHFKGYSDIINAQDYKVNKVTCLSAIGGTSGSIIDTFGTGAEILRDNTDIHVLNKRGRDNGVTIEYRKNLTGIEVEEDTTDLVTRIMPYAFYTNDNNEEIEVRGEFVDSPLINNYAHPYVKYIDYSQEFEDGEMPTKTKLNNLAKKEYTINKVDIPKCNYKIEFIPLSKCAGYEGLEDRINLCDIVTIKDTRYDIDTQAKVIKTTYNVLRDRYESMEVGDPKTTLGDIIGGTGDRPTQGPPGPPGPPGKPGEDGSIGDFPETLPEVPNINAKVYGFANIEISWTFENKVYYSYELYGSKTKGFVPNTFNLIFSGQASTYLYQAEPNETWYFRACAINTHGQRTEFSAEVKVNTVKISDLSNYVESAAIGDALIGELNLGRGWYGELKGNYIDAKQLSVTDGNGKRTLDIDSFGNVNLDVASLKIKSHSVATNNDVNDALSNYSTTTQMRSEIEQTANLIKNTVTESYYNKSEIDNKGYATSTELQQTATNFTYKFSQSGGYNLVRNGNPKPWHEENWWVSDNAWWYRWNANDLGIQTNDANESYAGSATFKVNSGSNYSFSCWVFAEGNTKGTDIYFIGSSNDDGAYEDIQHLFHGGKDGWTKVEATFTTGSNTRYGFIRIDNNGVIDASAGYNVVFFSEVQLVQGWQCYPMWSPNPNETYDGITTIDKNGIKVTASNINGYTHMTSSGFYLNKSGTDVFKVDSGGLSLRGAGTNSGRYIKIENEDYTVWNNNINCLRFGYKNWNGWDGVPEFLMGYKGFRYSETANTGEDASYFGMQTWGRWVRNNPNAYHEIYYRSDKFGDTSYIRFDEDGTVDYRSLGQTIIKHSASGHGIALGKYVGKDLSYVRPTLHNATDLGHESYCYRTIYATNGNINTSDISLKENINLIVSKANTPMLLIDNVKVAPSSEDYYEFVKTMPLYTYDYKSKDDEKDRALHNVGFIAQDIANTPVGDEFVFEGEDGIYQYNMQGYVGVLAVALQSALKKIDILEEKVSQLESKF